MTTKGRKYFSGNTLDHALMQAARHHALQPAEVAYRKIEKRHGFLRARKGVVIEVDPEQPRIAVGHEASISTEPAVSEPPSLELSAPPHSEPEAEPETEPEAESVGSQEDERQASEVQGETEPPVTGGDIVWGQPDRVDADVQTETPSEEASEVELIEAAKRGLEEILNFAQLDLESEIVQGDDQLEVELTGPDRDRLIEDRGNLLLAIQHLLPRLIRGYAGRSIPCHVDSENFHETREVELRRTAEEAAAEVRQQQRPRTLPPMNPAERRIIHVTLADEKDLSTESQGKGFFKRVTISPAMRRPRGFDRYSR